MRRSTVMTNERKARISFSAPVRRHLVAVTVVGWLRVGLTAAMILIIGRVIDGAVAGETALGGHGVALVVLVVARAVLAAIAPIITADATAVSATTARTTVLGHLLSLGPAIRASERTGDLVAKATEGIEAVSAYVGRFVPQLIQGVTVPLLIGGAVAFVDLPTGLVLIGVLPVAPLLFRLMESRFVVVSKTMRETTDRLSAQFLDALQGVTTLKMFNRAETHGEELAAEGEQLRQETMRLLFVNQTVLIVVDWVFALVTVIVATVMAMVRFQAGALSFGEAVAVVLLGALLVEPLTLIGRFFYVGAIGRAAQRQIASLLAISPLQEERRVAAPADHDGSLRMESVTFTYPDTDHPALCDVTWSVKAGETLAVVGPSGAGKSTLANLLLAFYPPDSGTISIGGHDAAAVSADWIRSQISLVGQGTYLFYGTMADNLRIAKPDATDTELEQAARAANIHHTIAAMPDGYATLVGERGLSVSGGEAQRIAIARALLKDTPIVILDEPTSHVDPEGEAAIRQELAHLTADRTVIIIAHRFSTIAGADRVVVLDEGRVVEEGRPDLLAAGTGHYASWLAHHKIGAPR